MTDNQNNKEKSYKRELESRRDTAREKSEAKSKSDETPEEKESLFRKMGKGKLGRYGKAAIAAGTLAGAQPGGAQMSDDDQIAEEMRKDQQQETTQRYEEPKQNQAERMFGEGATMSEQTEPHNAVNFEDINKKEDQQTLGEDLKRKPPIDHGEQAYASKISTQGGGRAPGELLQPKISEEAQGERALHTIDSSPLGRDAFQGSENKKQGVQEQAETSKYLNRKPAPDYGEQAKMSRISTSGGRVPGELLQPKPHEESRGSKTTKDAIDKAKDIKQSGGTRKGDAPGEQYMNLARQLKEAKKKAQKGDVVGIVKSGVNTAAQLSTARALSVAWYSLVPTFGLSILYINFHYVAHYFAHSPKFCGFGEEWMIQKMAKSGGATQAIKEAGTMLEIAEVGGMIVVNVLIAIFIFIVMTFGYFIINPIEGFELLVS